MKTGWLRLILMLTMLGGVSAWAGTATNAVAPAKLSYIVTLKREADQDGCARDFNVRRHHIYRHALNGFSADLDAAMVEKLRRDPRVLAVEQDGPITLCGQTVPSGIIRMGLTNFPVWRGNPINVNVAVMDTGIQATHPDLNVVQSAGFVDIPPGSPGYNGDDWSGHGTEVAGIAGALDNDFGAVGVAPGVRLWSVQIVGPTESAWANFLSGLDYIASNADQIEVINASISGVADGTIPYTAVHLAVSNVVSMGIVFVAAAGNNSTDIFGFDDIPDTPDDFLPAALPEVMAVSAMDPNPTNSNGSSNPNFDTIWGDSNFSTGPKSPNYVNSTGGGIDVAAPGVNILTTTINSDYATVTGTSGASPHVAGLVALYIAANGRAHSLQDVINIRQAIVNSSQSQSQWTPGGNPFDPITDNSDDNNIGYEPLAFPSEAWVPALNITSGSMTAQGFQISFPTVPGYTYMVQSATSLNSSNQWANLASTNGAGSLATLTVTDTNLSAASFYRVLRQPAP
jgi:subtilisin family serine protease